MTEMVFHFSDKVYVDPVTVISFQHTAEGSGMYNLNNFHRIMTPNVSEKS